MHSSKALMQVTSASHPHLQRFQTLQFLILIASNPHSLPLQQRAFPSTIANTCHSPLVWVDCNQDKGLVFAATKVHCDGVRSEEGHGVGWGYCQTQQEKENHVVAGKEGERERNMNFKKISSPRRENWLTAVEYLYSHFLHNTMVINASWEVSLWAAGRDWRAPISISGRSRGRIHMLMRKTRDTQIYEENISGGRFSASKSCVREHSYSHFPQTLPTRIGDIYWNTAKTLNW